MEAGISHLNYQVPREHGKTTVCAIALPLYRIALWRWMCRRGYPPTDEHQAVISTNQDVAGARTRQIKSELENNKLLIQDFGEFVGPKWTESEMIVAGARDVKNPTVFAAGIAGTMPGSRLTFAVLDDTTNPMHVRNVEQRDKQSNWVTTVLEPMMLPEGVIVGLHTPWHPDDLPIRLAKNTAWVSRKWAAWMDENHGPVLWPEQWPMERLLAKRKAMGPLAFAQQMLCEPYDPNETGMPPLQTWDRSWLTRQHGVWFMKGKRMRVITGVDPAIHKTEMRDRCAIVTVGMIVGEPEVYILEAHGGHWGFWRGVNEIVKAWQRWGSERVLIETNTFQESYKETLARWSALPVYGVENVTKDKYQRFLTTLHPVAANNHLWALPEQEEFQVEWATFPGEHDDYLDGLEMAVRELIGSSTYAPASSLVIAARRTMGSAAIVSNWGD